MTQHPTPLEIYKTNLKLLTDKCVDPWFAEQLAKSRTGDEYAMRKISGSCLQLVFEIAERRWKPITRLSLIEFTEEGNIVLVKTITRFVGTTATEFLEELKRNIGSWYTTILQHPAWIREMRDSDMRTLFKRRPPN